MGGAGRPGWVCFWGAWEAGGILGGWEARLGARGRETTDDHACPGRQAGCAVGGSWHSPLSSASSGTLPAPVGSHHRLRGHASTDDPCVAVAPHAPDTAAPDLPAPRLPAPPAGCPTHSLPGAQLRQRRRRPGLHLHVQVLGHPFHRERRHEERHSLGGQHGRPLQHWGQHPGGRGLPPGRRAPGRGQAHPEPHLCGRRQPD